MRSDNVAESRDALDATKGILIALIVLGHNQWIMRDVPFIRDFIYNWHVFGFFLITFLVPFKSNHAGFMRDRIVRYMIPFFAFFSLTMLASIRINSNYLELFDVFERWFLGAAIGSADLLDEASGARLYWYLPALTGLTLMRWAAQKCGVPGTYGLLLISSICFLFGGSIPNTWLKYIPLGLPIAAYVILPGLLLKFFIDWALAPARKESLPQCFAISLSVAVALSLLSIYRDTTLVLASLQVYSAFQPIALISHALLAVTAVTALVLGLHLVSPPRILLILGKYSLVIYLTHQFFFVPLQQLLVRSGFEQSAGTGVLLYLFTLAAALTLAAFVDKNKTLHRFLTPSDFNELVHGTKTRVT